MNTEKAKFLNAYFIAALNAFNDAMLKKPVLETKIAGKIVHFNQGEFNTYYHDFLDELEELILQIKDVNISYDYASGCLKDIKNWKGFPENQNKVIFRDGPDINFLIVLKKDIEYFARTITDFCRRDKNGDYGDEFYSFYYKVLKTLGTEFLGELTEYKLRVNRLEGYRIFNYYKFDIHDLKISCEKLSGTVSKLNFMQDELYDFRCMQLQAKESPYLEDKFTFTPDFEELCMVEIDRFNKKLELEMKVAALKNTDNQEEMPAKHFSTPYAWNATDTDLLELVAALHKEKIIKRNDKKELTRKELIEYFCGLFNLHIKDVEGKLTKATNRYDKTPFLDRLKKAFENFGLEKEEKQRKRR